MIPYLTAEQLQHALTYTELIDTLRQAFQTDIQAPTRHVHNVSEDPATTLLLMPAWQTGGNLGVKLVTVAPDNRTKHLPTVNSIFLLFDAVTGVPLALIDGEELTLRRTAAASALASSYLSRPDSTTLVVVGNGRLAPYMAEAHCTIRPINRIVVWGRSQSNAQAMASQMQSQPWAASITITSSTDLGNALATADIVTCATTSTVPIVTGAQVQPGTHIDLVGGFKPTMREADDDLMANATIVVDTFAGALAEAGDVIQPMQSGRLKREAVVAELADLARNRHGGRSGTREITVFKSVGTALEDLGAANLAWQRYLAKP